MVPMICCHGERAVRPERGNVQFGIENLHVGIRADVARSDLTLAGGLEIDGLGAVAVEAGDDALDVENDLGHVLGHAGDRGELVLHAIDADRGRSSAGERGEQDSAKGVPERRAVTALQRLDHILAVGSVLGGFDAFNARLLNFNHVRSNPPCEIVASIVDAAWISLPK